MILMLQHVAKQKAFRIKIINALLSLCAHRDFTVYKKIYFLDFLLLLLFFFFFMTKYCVNISSNSFNDTDQPLGTHLHIGLKLCISTGNSEILIKSDI